jgi:ubiquinol-cytochrome c reductase cytochrome b subunit
VGLAACWAGYALFNDRTHCAPASFITKILLPVPHMGTPIVSWLWQGFSVDDPVLSHFYMPYRFFVAILIGFALMLVSGTSKKRP